MRGGVAIYHEVGKRYGRLTVLAKTGADRYRVQCDCGETREAVRGSGMRSGGTLSCGCLGRARATASRLKHGCSRRTSGRTRAYKIWSGIRKRCLNPRSLAFPSYGARGISICARWNDFANFLADMGEPPSLKHSIGRIDNDGDYEPANCRWETIVEQNRNTRQNVYVTFRGRTQCIAAWAAELGYNEMTLRARICVYGWTVDRALTTPAGAWGKNHRFVEFNGERKRIGEWERELGLSAGAIKHRLAEGWPIERAFSASAVHHFGKRTAP